jgi:hypothetical protein
MKQYIVGIDLGTSNTVVAYGEAGSGDIRVFDIDQLVSPGEVAARPLLPSVRYHAARGELSAGDLQLPWSAVPDGADEAARKTAKDAAREAANRTARDSAPARPANPPGEREVEQPVVIGRLARSLGAQVPGRLVASAKSWLSHASVDRTAPILPWGAGEDIHKVSPVTASASYLAHVRAAWNQRFPHAPLEQQDVVLTVPASFDDRVARAKINPDDVLLHLVQALALPRTSNSTFRSCGCWKSRKRPSTTGCSGIAARLAPNWRTPGSC